MKGTRSVHIAIEIRGVTRFKVLRSGVDWVLCEKNCEGFAVDLPGDLALSKGRDCKFTNTNAS